MRLSQRPWPVLLAVVTLVGDVVAVIAGYDLAKAITDAFFKSQIQPTVPFFRASIFATIAIWPVVFALFGLYNPTRLMHVSRAEFVRGGLAAIQSTVLVVLVTFEAQAEPRRLFIPVLLVCCLLTVGIGRFVTRLLAFAANEW